MIQPGKITKIIIGIGCDRGTSQQTLETAIDRALRLSGHSRAAVTALATIDKKSDEPALLALSAQHRWPLHFHTAARLSEVIVPNPSETVRKHMGTPAVSEAAALVTAGVGIDNLILEKHKHRGHDGKHVTISLVATKDRDPAARNHHNQECKR
uniref:Cobalt-precorrin 5A hydrolase n=1 Tax=Candidatus Kentrum sp. MB TaxID=2138164 RepID=A0A450WY94_9GAMM|nr:MAG: cobalt-precorrin 5A hydrolase [Candidatus Kentron sp. MB]